MIFRNVIKEGYIVRDKVLTGMDGFREASEVIDTPLQLEMLKSKLPQVFL